MKMTPRIARTMFLKGPGGKGISVTIQYTIAATRTATSKVINIS